MLRLAALQLNHSEMALSVSSDGRSLVRQSDGAPIFLLGDTAWTLSHLLNREDMIHYLENRREHGFNVIFMSGVSEAGGLGPNAYGDRPFENDDVTKPLLKKGSDPKNPKEYDYWDHLEFFLREAANRGMYVALNPIYMDWYVKGGRKFRERGYVTVDNAEAVARFWGERFGRYGNIIWVLGGDINPDHHPDHLLIHRRMARGLAIGASGTEDYARVLMTYHPVGPASSGTWLHSEPWLDFNMQQTGQNDEPSYDRISNDYERVPPKPVLDGEPWYEAHPVRIRQGNREATDFDVRKRAYWAVFAGACGHIYGENSVMQFWAPGVDPYRGIDVIHWRQALERPGARQMKYLRRLIESRPMLDRVPDQTVLAGDPMTFNDRIQATRSADYLMVYSTAGNVIELHMGRISGETLQAWWFNPRDGSAYEIGGFGNSGRSRFQPPTRGIGQDWVLVLDDASKNYPTPGRTGVR